MRSSNAPTRETIQVEDPTMDFDLNNPNDRFRYAQKDIQHEEPDYNAIAQERKSRRESQERVSRSAINRLEILAGIARGTKDIEIGGVTFGLRTLKAREQKDLVMRATNSSNGFDEMFTVRIYTLAYGVYQIDGRDACEVLGTYKIDELAKIYEDFEESLVSKLHEEHTNMVKEHNSLVFKDLGQNSKEIVETIKK